MSDWLKINHSLLRSPKLKKLALLLGVDDDTALGCAVRWLMFIDEQTTDGNTELEPAVVDSVLGRDGASEALISIGWAVQNMSQHMCAVDYEKHCGDTAKRRSEDARRKALSRLRAKNKTRPRSVRALSQKNVTRKEYNISKDILSDGAAHADAAAPLEVETEEEAAAARKAEQEYLAALMRDLA